jgi:hypothetical protein
MSSRLSRALTEFAEGRWPGHRDRDRDSDSRRTDPHDFDPHEMDPRSMEPPLHPSELDRFEGGQGGRWPIARWIPVAFVRFLLFFFVGVATTLAWQSYGNAARRMVANLAPGLGWLVPAPAAPAVAPGSSVAAPAAASPEQVAALSRSLAAVRQSVDRLAADIGKLQAPKQDPKQDPQARTSAAPISLPPPATATASRKPAATAQVQQAR